MPTHTRLLAVALMLSTVVLSSCGTLTRGSYFSSRPSPGLYMGTRSNFALLTSPVSLQVCWPLIVCPLVFIATAPVDIVVDTVLIPYDASR